MLTWKISQYVFFYGMNNSYCKILIQPLFVYPNFPFQTTIVTVEKNINDMLQFQHHSRGREQWDHNILKGNNSYVVVWSVIQIVVILIASSLQVYFVRKLFDIKVGGGKMRI